MPPLHLEHWVKLLQERLLKLFIENSLVMWLLPNNNTVYISLACYLTEETNIDIHNLRTENKKNKLLALFLIIIVLSVAVFQSLYTNTELQWSQKPWTLMRSSVASLICTKNVWIFSRWSPCSWITSPCSEWSTTVPLQLNCCQLKEKQASQEADYIQITYHTPLQGSTKTVSDGLGLVDFPVTCLTRKCGKNISLVGLRLCALGVTQLWHCKWNASISADCISLQMAQLWNTQSTKHSPTTVVQTGNTDDVQFCLDKIVVTFSKSKSHKHKAKSRTLKNNACSNSMQSGTFTLRPLERLIHPMLSHKTFTG